MLRLAATAAALASLALPAAASATTLHVDRDSLGGPCSDSRPAAEVTAEQPLCSIPAALERVATGGGEVVVRRAAHPALRVRDLAPAAPIVVRAAPGERPDVAGVDIERSSELAFEGLRFTDLVRFETASTLRFSGNEVVRGGIIGGGASGVLFEGNKIHDLWIDLRDPKAKGRRCNRFQTPGLAPYCGFGLRLNNIYGVTVRGNELWNIPADGLQLMNAHGVLLEHNHLHDINAFQDRNEHSDGMQLLGGNSDITVRNNRFERTRGIIAQPFDKHSGSTTGLVVENNLFGPNRNWALNLLDTPGARIVNNTIWDSSRGVRLIEYPGGRKMQDVVLVNNILIGLEAKASMFGVEDHNLIAVGPRLGAHDRKGKPGFVDARAGDYRLAPGSQAIGAGTTALGPAGDLLGFARDGAPDLGAIEFGAVHRVVG